MSLAFGMVFNLEPLVEWMMNLEEGVSSVLLRESPKCVNFFAVFSEAPVRIATGFLLSAAFALEPAGLQPLIPEIERDALVAIYNSTDGEGWYRADDWLGPPGSEPSWYGVTVENGHVTGLDLSSNYLEGTLPPEIGYATVFL